MLTSAPNHHHSVLPRYFALLQNSVLTKVFFIGRYLHSKIFHPHSFSACHSLPLFSLSQYSGVIIECSTGTIIILCIHHQHCMRSSSLIMVIHHSSYHQYSTRKL